MTFFKYAVQFLLMMSLVPLINCQPRPNRQNQGPPLRGFNLNARGPGPGGPGLNRMGGLNNLGRRPNGPQGIAPNGPLGQSGPLNPYGPRGGPPFFKGSLQKGYVPNRGPNRLQNNQKGNLGNFNVEYQIYDSLDDSEQNYYPQGKEVVSVESNGATDEDYFPHGLENDRVQIVVDEKLQQQNKLSGNKNLYYSGPNPAKILDLNVPPLENRILKTENNIPKSQDNLRIEKIQHKSDIQGEQGSREFHLINNNNIDNKIGTSDRKIESFSHGQKNDNKKLVAEIVSTHRESSKQTVNNKMNNDLIYHDYKVKESNPRGEINYDHYDGNNDDNSKSPGYRPITYSGDQSFSLNGNSWDSGDHTKDEDHSQSHDVKMQFDTGQSGESDFSNDVDSDLHSQRYSAETQFNSGHSEESAGHTNDEDVGVHFQRYSAETQFNTGHSGESVDHNGNDAEVGIQMYSAKTQFNTGPEIQDKVYH